WPASAATASLNGTRPKPTPEACRSITNRPASGSMACPIRNGKRSFKPLKLTLPGAGAPGSVGIHVEQFGAHQMTVLVRGDRVQPLEQRRKVAGVLIPHRVGDFRDAQVALL